MREKSAFEIECGFAPGLIGDVVAMHGRYYASAWRFTPVFEYSVARNLTEFYEAYDARLDGAFFVRDSGAVKAFVAISVQRAAPGDAHLRWFIADETLHGSGVGRQLLMRAIGHCVEARLRRVELFTFEGLNAARHLYREAGFELIDARPSEEWGPSVLLERYELHLDKG